MMRILSSQKNQRRSTSSVHIHVMLDALLKPQDPWNAAEMDLWWQGMEEPHKFSLLFNTMGEDMIDSPFPWNHLYVITPRHLSFFSHGEMKKKQSRDREDPELPSTSMEMMNEHWLIFHMERRCELQLTPEDKGLLRAPILNHKLFPVRPAAFWKLHWPCMCDF